MGRKSTGIRGRSLAVLCLVSLISACALTLFGLGILAKPRGLVDKLSASYAVIDLTGGKFRAAPVLADDSETFSSLVSRVKPYAAITGTYYDENRKPMGDIVIGGKLVSRGYQRQGIGFTRSGRIRFVERKGRGRIDWRGCESGIACGPRLVRAGRLDINMKRDGFSKSAASKEADRCAVGATREGKLILCVIGEPVTLDTLGRVMLELGARDAINLDGGSMCAFYENGRYCAEPTRPMSSVLAVYRR